MTKRVILLVLDSVGCGGAPDAHSYGDGDANTLGHLSLAVGGLRLPNLQRLGLGNVTPVLGVRGVLETDGAWGRLTETSPGKDTTTGHWELCGLVLGEPFPVYPDGFPAEVMQQFESAVGRGTLGNYPASGTEIIKDLGPLHMASAKPIIYTSADSVFQIAAHEDVVPLDELYRICRAARQILTGKYNVCRVIARPFIGEPGSFIRTEGRRDFSLPPPGDTILDALCASGSEVIGVGKIEDIFAHRGLTASEHTGNNTAALDAILSYLDRDFGGLIMANLPDFDQLYGHRNDAPGYAKALEEFDSRLPELLSNMHSGDVLMITADHGNDPTTPGTDHSREGVPILVCGDGIKKNVRLGARESFADVAATIGELLRIPWHGAGCSFAAFL